MGIKIEPIDKMPQNAKPVYETKQPKIKISGEVDLNKMDLSKVKPLYVKDESGIVGSFFKGWTKTYDDLASGVNWLGEKVTGALGLDSAEKFFRENREFWNTQSKLNDIETHNHPYAHLAGEILNPTIAVPVGDALKVAKVADVAKSALKSGGVLGALEGMQVAGREDMSDKEKIKQTAIAGGLGVAGDVILGGLKLAYLKLRKTAPKIADELDDAINKNDNEKLKEVIDTIKANPEKFGLTKDEAEKYLPVLYEKKLPAFDDTETINPEIIDSKVLNMYPNYRFATLIDKGNPIVAYPPEKPKLTRFPQDNSVIEAQYNPFVRKMLPQKELPENTEFIYSNSPYKASVKNNDNGEITLDLIKSHPEFETLVKQAKNLGAKDIAYSKKRVADSYLNPEELMGGSYMDAYHPAVYDKNWASEYMTTKSVINRILKGKATQDDLLKAWHDLQLLEKIKKEATKKDPELDLKVTALQALEKKDYDTLEKILPEIQDEKFVNDIANELMSHTDERAGNIAGAYLFANANQRLAGGMLGGTYNAIENPDQNNDGYVTDNERMIAFLKGFGIGALSPEALKVLKKISPQTYEKLAKLAKTDTNGQVAGAFVGKATKDIKTDPYKNIAEYAEKYYNKGWDDIDLTPADEGTLKGTITAINNEIRRWFKNTRSGEYMRAYSKMKSDQNKYIGSLENLFNLLSDLSPQHKADLIDYIEKVPKEYSPEIQQLGKTIQDTIGKIQKELIEAGFDPEYVNKYGVNYVARLYKDKLGTNRLGKFIMGDKLAIYTPKKERGKTEIVSEKKLQEMIKNGEIDKDKIGKPLIEGGVEIIPLENKKGYYKIKRDWTPEEREAMGQIKDADVIIPLTLMRLNSMRAVKNFFDEVSKIDGAVVNLKEYMKKSGLSEEQALKELKRQGYERIPNSAKYGSLAGQVVRKDVYDDITYLADNIFDDSVIKDLWKKYLTAWKKSKTIYNTSAHFNNFVNNLALAWYAGMPLRDVPKYFANAFKDLRKYKQLSELEKKFYTGKLTENELEKLKNLQNETKYVKEAKELGLLDTSMLRDILDYSNFEDIAPQTIGGKGVLGKVSQKLSDAYQAEDNIGKLAMYKALREKGYDPQKAKDIVTLFMPDYATPLPKGIRALRDSAVAPFISWVYYVLPHLIRYTYGDLFKAIKTGNTKDFTKAVTNPAVRKLLGLIALIEAGQYVLTEGKVSPVADLNPFDNTKPAGTSFVRMGIGADGNIIHTLKIDRLLPQTLLIPNQWSGQLQQTLSGILPSFIVASLLGEKMYNGQPITYPNRPAVRQAYDWIKYLTESYAPIPATITQAYDTFIDPKVRDALYPHKKRSGNQLYQPRNTTQNLLKLITGINTLSYDQRLLKKKNSK